MDRNVFFRKIKDELVKAITNPLVRKKEEIDTRDISFEEMWDKMGNRRFTGYLLALTDQYKWHTFVIDGHVKFSAFFGKGIVLRGKESLLSMKSKWNNPPITVFALTMDEKSLAGYYGMFSGLKIFDGINPETIGIDRVFEKIKEERITGTAIFDTKDNKIGFISYNGSIIHVFPVKNIVLSVDERVLEEVILSPFLNITVIKAHKMTLDIPYSKLLYSKRAAEMNALLECFQNKLAKAIGRRLITLIAHEVKNRLTQRHPFYSDLLQIKDGIISMEPKVMDRGISSDFDEVVREILEIYVARANEDAGRNLVRKFFKECKEKEVKEVEENN